MPIRHNPKDNTIKTMVNLDQPCVEYDMRVRSTRVKIENHKISVQKSQLKTLEEMIIRFQILLKIDPI